MLEQFDKLVLEFGSLHDNDGWDIELDELAYNMNALLLLMSEDEIRMLLKRNYISEYKELIKSLLIQIGRWEEEYGN